MKPEDFQARVARIVARAELPPLRMWEDQQDQRIRIQFQLQPDTETRQLLKAHGFSYRGGIANYWTRKLDFTGKQAASFIMATLTERSPEDNA